MSKLSSLRKPTAIAPGFTVRAYEQYKAYGQTEEVVSFDGILTNLTHAQANRLYNWLDRWVDAKAAAEVEAENRAIEAEARAIEASRKR